MKGAGHICSQLGWYSHWAGQFDPGFSTQGFSYHSSVNANLCLLSLEDVRRTFLVNMNFSPSMIQIRRSAGSAFPLGFPLFV